MKLAVNLLVYGMLFSIPTLIFSAFWFNNGNLLGWLAIPLIFFMAG